MTSFRQAFYRLMIIGGLLPTACGQNPEVTEVKRVDYAQLPAFTDRGINMVVEIPAGTNRKIEYRKERDEFAADTTAGRAGIVRFLPYPGNYGFIPATLMDRGRGGDGGPLDVFLISESRPTGSVVEVRPLAALRLRNGGEIDTKIIAIPVDSSQWILEVENYRDFMIRYDGARRIIEEWFLNYQGFEATELLGWEDENYARREIEKRAVGAVPSDRQNDR